MSSLKEFYTYVEEAKAFTSPKFYNNAVDLADYLNTVFEIHANSDLDSLIKENKFKSIECRLSIINFHEETIRGYLSKYDLMTNTLKKEMQEMIISGEILDTQK